VKIFKVILDFILDILGLMRKSQDINKLEKQQQDLENKLNEDVSELSPQDEADYWNKK
jgi:predicted house-cleaning noncanonical NTP pyrophosphatase (MazG superfamily)